MFLNFNDFLMNLSFRDKIQSHYDVNKKYRILFIDTINSKILLSINNNLLWFTEIDFIFGRLCR